MQQLARKFKETFQSVLPIMVIVLVLHLSVAPLAGDVFWRFMLGSAFIVFGLTLFILGVDSGITPIGECLGDSMTRANKLWLLTAVGLVLGIVITVAEPSLIILAEQIDQLTASVLSNVSIIVVVSIGTAVMLAVGLLRIVYNWSLRRLLLIAYAIICAAAALASNDFLGLAFDASGATTGALAVPFILAIALGTSRMKKDSQSGEEDSFGLVGVASIGGIIAVLLMGILRPTGALGTDAAVAVTERLGILAPFLENFWGQTAEVLVALFPILLVFLLGNALSFRMRPDEFSRIVVGILFATVGLIFFLLGVNQGFMEVGALVGAKLAASANYGLIVLVSFILGVVTILAEPAVHILTRQIEEVTSGYVKRQLVMITLALGVGAAVALSALRVILPGLQLWHLLLPGYVLAIGLMRYTPALFVGIAFDSGGVASGPMTATFVLAFVQGVALQTEGANVILDGFGVIALVAMVPLVALQLLGVSFAMQQQRERVLATHEEKGEAAE